MSDFNIIELGQSKEIPAKMVIYGVPKIGKSRFCSNAPDPFYINIEGGLDYLDKKVKATPKLNTYDEVIGWLKHIYDNDAFKCETIVIDSFDWLERLAQTRLIKMHAAENIRDIKVAAFSYNKGVDAAADDCNNVLRWLDAIYKKRCIKAIVIAHCELKTVDVPNKDSYSRYQLKLSKGLSAVTIEWADLVVFADYSYEVSKEGVTSEPKPMLMAGGSVSFIGGGRMKLTKEIPLNYAELVKQITK
jgi:AAA domain